MTIPLTVADVARQRHRRVRSIRPCASSCKTAPVSRVRGRSPVRRPAASGTSGPCIIPALNPFGTASGAPTASGLGVIDTSLVPALTMHYNGAGASTVTVTIGTTSLDFSTQNLPSIFTTLTLTAS